MTNNEEFEQIRRENTRKWMANARETAQSFIRPMPRTSRLRRYGPPVSDRESETWETLVEWRGEPVGESRWIT